MPFNTYEELKAAVEARRQAVLTLEVDLGSGYSPAYEDAKKELAQAKAMKTVVGGGGFLGGDNIAALEQRVAELKPDGNPVWIQYKQLDLDEWAKLVKGQGLTPIDQYEKVLTQVFIGLYGHDPVKPDDAPEDWEAPEPLTKDPSTVSFKGTNGILPGGAMNSVVQSFMAWQNSGGDVTIRPTKSGQD